MIRAWVFVIAAGCVQSKALICQDGHVCPSDLVCDNANGGCVHEDQITNCAGATDATMCSYPGEPIGFCKNGVCFASTCGDGIVSAPEQCDGSDLAGQSCLDHGFYARDGLTCDALTCEYDISQCQQSCGDRGQHLLNGPEVCDGSPPSSRCPDFGFGMGVIGCTGACGPDLVGCRALRLEPQAGGVADIAGLWVASPSLAFAVGGGGEIDRYDGTKWSPMVSGTTVDLARVWGASASDVYAVGAAGTLLHFDGTAWTAIASGTSNALWGVWGTSGSDVFAVGDGGTILHFDGTAWTPMTSPTSNTLRGVWGTSPTDVYAVGLIGQNVLHYNGSWTAQPVTAAFGNLNDVWGSGPGDIYAVGLNAGKTPAVFHLAAGVWTDVTPAQRPSGPLRAVWGASSQDVFAVGAGGEVLHYAGVAWRTLARIPQPLSAVSGSDTTNLMIGGDAGTLLGFDGTAALAEPMATAAGFARGVAATSNGEIFAVGDELVKATTRDQIHHFKNGVWATEPSGIPNPLRGVWIVSSNTVIAVGDGDNTHDMVEYNGTTGLWSVLTTSPATRLHAIWGAGGEAFAVGELGTVQHTTNSGGTWASSIVGVTSIWEAAWGASTSDVFIAGSGGGAAHYNGFQWTVLAPPTAGNLYAVAGTSGSDVYFAGDAGTLLHYDGANWTPVPIPVTTRLVAVWAGPGDDLFVGGDAGVLLHRVAGAWIPIDTSAVLGVQAITGAGRSVYVVGASPSLLELYRTTLAAGPETACADYWDDDGNGLIDACDPACAGRAPAEQCANGFDDDCDGMVDCADPDCAHDPSCTTP